MSEEIAATLPAVLRELLQAEQAIGNTVERVSRSFPAPPGGLCVHLAQAVTTRPQTSAPGLRFRVRNSALYSGEFSDVSGRFLIVEPPCAVDTAETLAGEGEDTPLRRFERSLEPDLERWRDGVGYDLDAWREADGDQRALIESLLLRRGIDDWRDVQALAAIDSPEARARLGSALGNARIGVRIAVLRLAPALASEAQHSAILVEAIRAASLGDGFSQALDLAAHCRTEQVIDALWSAAHIREREAAMACALLLLHVHGLAATPFDLSQRPSLGGFMEPPGEGRTQAIAQLRDRIAAACG